MKILISGNSHYGVAGAVCQKYTDVTACSRETGFDLTTSEAQKNFAKLSLDYDCTILSSSLQDFQQILLLEQVIELWRQEYFPGQLIAIGSTVDKMVQGRIKLYDIEKKSLRAYCQNLNLLSLGSVDKRPIGFRVTYLSLGHLETPSTKKRHPKANYLNLSHVVSVIDWIINQPKDVSINEVSMDPLQLK